MGKPNTAYLVTHSYAPDSDPAKVQAALDYWKEALAETVLASSKPIVRFTLPGRKRAYGRKRRLQSNR